ncbi:GNAT family N-acetyltransferase [Bacillus sp. KH172YL63]|uniref:GNAT family N-acetyltransferase n=1 Tax=Bacillus sp. KH172YL63 TaxID=2709784 RepID=UPI0013E47555|nr:GNAT family protein [Bacillus sp. KH172YL63]BCB03744.1 ribosomal-protein-serine acetyltransferase [Bacillus sp. KH172YL63]
MFTYRINEELALRLLEERDAERMYELIDGSRQYLQQWLPWVAGTKAPEDSREFIKGTRLGFAQYNSLTAGIIFRDELVGVAGFNELDWSNQAASIGYWLGEGYQGKGIMTTVTRELIQYGFKTLKLNRIEIRAAEFNHRSRAIPERLGFKEEGKLRQKEQIHDRYVDHVVYGMLAKEWETA